MSPVERNPTRLGLSGGDVAHRKRRLRLRNRFANELEGERERPIVHTAAAPPLAQPDPAGAGGGTDVSIQRSRGGEEKEQ